MMNIDSKIADRIRKLLQLSKSSNEHEAAAAAARAAQMMEEYQIAEAMLRVTDDTKTAEPIIEGQIGGQRKRVAWKVAIAGGAAAALGLSEVWTMCGTMLALGRDSSVKTWSYLCSYLYNEVDRLADEAWGGEPAKLARWNDVSARSWKNAFRYGAAITIRARLMVQADAQNAGRKAAVKAAAQLASGNGEATGATMALAVIARDKTEIDAAYEKRAEKFSKGRAIGQVSSLGGYEAGQRAGEKVNLAGGGRQLKS